MHGFCAAQRAACASVGAERLVRAPCNGAFLQESNELEQSLTNCVAETMMWMTISGNCLSVCDFAVPYKLTAHGHAMLAFSSNMIPTSPQHTTVTVCALCYRLHASHCLRTSNKCLQYNLPHLQLHSRGVEVLRAVAKPQLATNVAGEAGHCLAPTDRATGHRLHSQLTLSLPYSPAGICSTACHRGRAAMNREGTQAPLCMPLCDLLGACTHTDFSGPCYAHWYCGRAV